MCMPKAPKMPAPPPPPPPPQASRQADINETRRPKNTGPQAGSLLSGGTAMGGAPNIGGASLLGQ